MLSQLCSCWKYLQHLITSLLIWEHTAEGYNLLWLAPAASVRSSVVTCSLQIYDTRGNCQCLQGCHYGYYNGREPCHHCAAATWSSCAETCFKIPVTYVWFTSSWLMSHWVIRDLSSSWGQEHLLRSLDFHFFVLLCFNSPFSFLLKHFVTVKKSAWVKFIVVIFHYYGSLRWGSTTETTCFCLQNINTSVSLYHLNPLLALLRVWQRSFILGYSFCFFSFVVSC